LAMWCTVVYKQALDLQRLLVADSQKPKCTPRERCLLARAFKELEELKLRLRMKPAPKPVDVSLEAGRKRRLRATEPLFAEQDSAAGTASPK